MLAMASPPLPPRTVPVKVHDGANVGAAGREAGHLGADIEVLALDANAHGLSPR